MASGSLRRVIKACLNGAREPGAHPSLPLTAEQLAIDAAASVAAGAQVIHMHPRGPDGRESLATADETVRAVRAAVPGVPVGVSTGAWIEPDLDARVAAIEGWREPDMASVNLSEDGHVEVMGALERAGVGIEGGVWSVADVEALAASGYADRLVRVLLEPQGEDSAVVLGVIDAIHAALDAAGITAPRVQHGYELVTWDVIRHAREHGHGWRVGLEDTLVLPDGARAESNAHLVTAGLDV